MEQIIIGNVISLIGAICLAVSCCANTIKKAYFFQLMESSVLFISSFFFGAWAGVTTLFLSIIRNVLVIKGKFDKKSMVICTVLVFVCGVIVNNRGFIGLLPVMATVQITLCNYYARQIMAIKVSFLVNVLLWAVYSLIIHDFSSGITQSVTAVLSIISIVRLKLANDRIIE
jgi:hypothetical protein